MTMGIGTNILGYSNSFVNKAVIKAIKNSNLIESNRDNHPANGMITTSAIKYADITYETLSNPILRAP